MSDLTQQARQASILASVGAAAMVLGSFGPWAKGFGGLVSVSGIDGGGDGWLSVVAGLLVAGVVYHMASRRRTSAGHAIVLFIGAAAGGWIAYYDIGNVSDRGEFVQVGWGLYVVAAGALAAGLGGLGLLMRGVAPPPSAATPPSSPAPPAGWYADPAGGNTIRRRWWDGQKWTEHWK